MNLIEKVYYRLTDDPMTVEEIALPYESKPNVFYALRWLVHQGIAEWDYGYRLAKDHEAQWTRVRCD
jgi:hypothetical protein